MFDSKVRLTIPLLLFLLTLLTHTCESVRSLTPSLNDDVLGLIVFKADLQDPDGKLSFWNEDDDTPCNWMGVKCDPRSNRVVEVFLDGFSLSGRIGRGLLQLQYLHKLSLSRNNLTGNLPIGLATLDNLRIVDFSHNSLYGSLPDFFEQCGGLRSISLANNKFQGVIPDSLSSCTGVASLDLSSNQLSGSLPPGISQLNALRSLDLSANLLAGEIPKEISSLNNLRSINLSRNKFNGSIPDELGSCLLLKAIDLSDNLLSGSIPASFHNLQSCSSVILNNNALTGDIPPFIGEMRSLEVLELSGNKLSGNFPVSIGNAKLLKVLNVSRNWLSGSVPKSIGSCANLQAMDFSHNMMTGDLSTLGFFNSLPNLQILDLSTNNFSGKIPSFVDALLTLQFLNLSRNELSGEIPQSVGNLIQLKVLDLSDNNLNGSIPVGIGGAFSLQDLRFSENKLMGEIPASIGNCSLLTSLMLSNNSLSGSIPVALGRLSNLRYVNLAFNNLNGSLPKQLANLPNLSVFNVSHNRLQGQLPGSGFFNTISSSSISDNPLLCGALASKACPAVLPKPIVLNPNSSDASSVPLLNKLGHKRIILSISALIAIGAAAFIFVGVIAISVLNLRVRSLSSAAAPTLGLSGGDDFSGSATSDANSGKLVMFSGEDFSAGAHALLNKDCELGRGGFGAVYRSVLRDGRAVAIKKLTVSSLVKSQEDFEREVKKLGKIRHPNLVSLNGYYWTQSLQLLIYDYIPGGNLNSRLHGGDSLLSWNERFNVILGVARALTHLHQQNIIHYNIKSSNVLIDGAGDAKLGDFGLARLLPMLDRYVLSNKVQSALGYMAPEFACRTVKITEKCDVYGFGALVLEVVTGKMPVEYMEDDVVVLCDMVRGALENERVEECVDERLREGFPAEEVVPVIKLGLICTSQVPSSRPEMAEVVKILELIRCPEECR